MEKAVDAFGQEIKLGQLIVYASALNYAMKMKAGIVVRITQKVREWQNPSTELIVSVLNEDGERVGLRVLAGVCAVQPNTLPKELVDKLNLSVEMKYGQAICDLDQTERTNKSETYIGVD